MDNIGLFPNKNQLWKFFFSCLVLIFLSGCLNIEITEEEAIDAAVDIASGSAPEISASQVPVSNVKAEKTTLGEVINRLGTNPINVSKYSSDMVVWLVTMDGLWLPPNVPEWPILKPYRHMSIILDAKTSLEIYRRVLP